MQHGVLSLIAARNPTLMRSKTFVGAALSYVDAAVPGAWALNYYFYYRIQARLDKA